MEVFIMKKIIAMLVTMIMTTSATPTAVTAFDSRNKGKNSRTSAKKEYRNSRTGDKSIESP
jgi:hypothetical protein